MKLEINLLSPEAKKARMRLVWNRRVNAIGDALLICIVLVACSYAASFWALSEIRASLAQRADTNKEDVRAAERSIRESNALFSAVAGRIAHESLWTPLISDIVRIVPSEISITKLQLLENPRALSLVGKTTQGSAIVQYQRELEKLPWVDRVVAPLQNFAVTPDATVTFTIYRAQEAPL